MDEKGFLIGLCEAVKVICRKGRKNPRLSQEGVRELVTVIETVCANGTELPSFVITKGKYFTLGEVAFANEADGTTLAKSIRGWTDNELGIEWLDHFEKNCSAE